MGATYILIADYDQLHGFLKILHQKTEELFNLHYYTNLKVEALKQEWFGDGAEAFFEIMDNRLLPAMVKVIEALYATQDRIKEVMRTIHHADEETRIYFSEDALNSDIFASRLFLETLSEGAIMAGLAGAAGAVGGAAGLSGVSGGENTSTGTSASGGTSAGSGTSGSTNSGEDVRHHRDKSGGGSGQASTPEKQPAGSSSKAPRSGEMSGLSDLGASLKNGPASSALVGGAGDGQQGALEQGSAGGSGGGASGGSSGSAAGGGASVEEAGGSGTPAPGSGLAGAAGIGAGVAGAAALGGAAKVVKEDEQEE